VFKKWLRVKHEHEFEGMGLDHGRPWRKTGFQAVVKQIQKFVRFVLDGVGRRLSSNIYYFVNAWMCGEAE
jgi:hypothetical protein